MKKFAPIIVSLIVLVALALPATADHANPRRWKANNGSTTVVKVVDRTGISAWHTATNKNVNDWNAGNTNLRLTWATGTGACNFEPHTINICMGYANGYDGYAEWKWDWTGYLSGARITLDTNRTANLSTFWRNYLICHEVGHTFLLNHSTDTGSCMGGWVDRPNAHDYQAVATTYGWLAATPTTTTTTTQVCTTN